MAENKLLKEWEAARDDLGINIVAPYEVALGNSRKIHADIFVPDFGHDNGTLIFRDTEAVWPHREELSKLGYGYSVLEEPSADVEHLYDREPFIEMLSEWGWTGNEADKPEWLLPQGEDK
jgi:hypothetical protein